MAVSDVFKQVGKTGVALQSRATGEKVQTAINSGSTEDPSIPIQSETPLTPETAEDPFTEMFGGAIAKEAETHAITQQQNQEVFALDNQMRENLYKANNATASEKFDSFIGVMGDSSPAVKAINRTAINQVFKTNKTDETYVGLKGRKYTLDTLMKNNLPWSTYNMELLENVNNFQDEMFVLKALSTDQQSQADSANLGQGAQITAGLSGAILTDPTMFMFTPAKVFQGVLQGKRLYSALAVSNGGLQYGLSQFRDYGDPTRTTSDTMIDVFFGMTLDSFLSVRGISDTSPAVQNTTQEFVTASGNVKAESNYNRSVGGYQTVDLSKSYGGWRTVNPTAEKPYADTVTTPKRASDRRIDDYNQRKLDESLETEVEIRKFKDQQKVELKNRIKSSGLTAKEFLTIEKNLDTDVKELTKMVKDIVSEQPVKQLEMLDDIQAIAQKMGKVSKSAEDKIKFQIEKAKGNVPKEAKIAFNNKKLAFNKGARAYNKNVKQFNKTIKATVKQARAKFEEIGGFKALKPLEETKLTKVEQSTLTKARDRIAKLETQQGRFKDPARLAKIDAEMDELLKVEDDLMKKLEDGTKARENSVAYHLNKQKEIYERMASVADELMFELNTSLKGILDDVYMTPLSKRELTKNLSKEMSEVMGQNVAVKFNKQGELVFDADLVLPIQNGMVQFGGKKLALAVVMSLVGADALMADDGSSVNVLGTLGMGIVLVAVGVTAFKSIKDAGGLSNAVGRTTTKINAVFKKSEYMGTTEYKNLEETRKSVVDTMNTGFLNSFQLVQDKGSELSRTLGQALGVDSVDPNSGIPAIWRRMRDSNKVMLDYFDSEELNYQSWLNAIDESEGLKDRILSAGQETVRREEFQNHVTDFMEFGGDDVNEFIQAQAKLTRELYNEVAGEANKLGIMGFSDDALKADNYIPRKANHSSIKAAVASGGRKDLVKGIAESIQKAQPDKNMEEILELADSMVEGYLNVGFNGGSATQVSRMLHAMKKLGMDVDGVDAGMLASEMRIGSDAISRGKFRVDMDLSAFKNFKTIVDGVEVEFNIHKLFERNSGALLETYTRQVHGMMALKSSTKGMKIGDETLENGIESESALRELINKDPNSTVKETLNAWSDSLLGYPIVDPTKTASRVATTMTDFAYPLLSLVHFGMAGEYATIIQRMIQSSSARKQGFKEVGSFVRQMFGGERTGMTAVQKELIGMTGLGSGVIRRESSFRTADEMFNITEDIGSTSIEKAARSTKYFTLYATRLIHADDSMKAVAHVFHAEQLAHLSNGKITMSANRMARLGIDDDFLQSIKGKLNLDKDGNLIDGLDFKNLDEATRDKLGMVLYRMVTTDSPNPLISSLPLFNITSNAGRLLGFLTNFIVQSYTSKALAGLKYPDAKSAMETMIYTMGMYAGLYAKEVAQGREVDEEELLKRTLMMSPVTAPLAVGSMAYDPASLASVDVMQRGFTQLSNAFGD